MSRTPMSVLVVLSVVVISHDSCTCDILGRENIPGMFHITYIPVVYPPTHTCWDIALLSCRLYLECLGIPQDGPLLGCNLKSRLNYPRISEDSLVHPGIVPSLAATLKSQLWLVQRYLEIPTSFWDDSHPHTDRHTHRHRLHTSCWVPILVWKVSSKSNQTVSSQVKCVQWKSYKGPSYFTNHTWKLHLGCSYFQFPCGSIVLSIIKILLSAASVLLCILGCPWLHPGTTIELSQDGADVHGDRGSGDTPGMSSVIPSLDNQVL